MFRNTQKLCGSENPMAQQPKVSKAVVNGEFHACIEDDTTIVVGCDGATFRSEFDIPIADIGLLSNGDVAFVDTDGRRGLLELAGLRVTVLP